MQNFIKLRAAVHELSCSLRKNSVESNTAPATTTTTTTTTTDRVQYV